MTTTLVNIAIVYLIGLAVFLVGYVYGKGGE